MDGRTNGEDDVNIRPPPYNKNEIITEFKATHGNIKQCKFKVLKDVLFLTAYVSFVYI